MTTASPHRRHVEPLAVLLYREDHGARGGVWTDEGHEYRELYRDTARKIIDQLGPEIAADALRDAADALDLPGSDATGYYASYHDDCYREAERHIDAWLRHRARCPHPKCPGGSLCCCPEEDS